MTQTHFCFFQLYLAHRYLLPSLAAPNESSLFDFNFAKRMTHLQYDRKTEEKWQLEMHFQSCSTPYRCKDDSDQSSNDCFLQILSKVVLSTLATIVSYCTMNLDQENWIQELSYLIYNPQTSPLQDVIYTPKNKVPPKTSPKTTPRHSSDII